MRKTIRSCVVEMVKASGGKVPTKEVLQKLRTEFPNVKWLKDKDERVLLGLVKYYNKYSLQLIKEGANTFVTISSPKPRSTKRK